MATFDDVRRLALALPETSESTRRSFPTWLVRKDGFAWDRPLRKTDVRQLSDLGQEIPEGDVLALRIESVGVREAIIAGDPGLFFTVPHFHDYPAVLLRLGEVELDELAEILEEAWLAVAPKRLADAYLAERGGPEG
jgi:hypothetical protein